MSKIALYNGGGDARPLRIWSDFSTMQYHPDCRGRTGATMSLGRDSIAIIPRKQKNRRNKFYKTEMIASHDVAPQVLWREYFIQAQGFDLEEMSFIGQ